MTIIFSEFPAQAPCANPVFYRTYSRRFGKGRETWKDVNDRTIGDLVRLGRFSEEDASLVSEMQANLYFTTSGRWLWVGGTEWVNKPTNFYGAYNCSSILINDWEDFPRNFDLSMQGCGVGAVLELGNIEDLPGLNTKLNLSIKGEPGDAEPIQRTELSMVSLDSMPPHIMAAITVGDTREGWTEAYRQLFRLAMGEYGVDEITVTVNISHVRPKGTPIKGFGGVANPQGLPRFYKRTAEIINTIIDNGVDSVKLSKLLNEAALCAVAGNVRRSARIDQFSWSDNLGATAKDNLWVQDPDTGKWAIDPERDCLRMANHTRVTHNKPSYDEVEAAVRKQYYSGEGAIMYAPEAIARANVDIITNGFDKHTFLVACEDEGWDARLFLSQKYLEVYGEEITQQELDHRMGRYGLNPCGEVIGRDFFCNLAQVHLEMIDPLDMELQIKAFRAATLSCVGLLHHKFPDEKFMFSREKDPIVQVTFTGLFDFFVKAFGDAWLEWWMAGRPEKWGFVSTHEDGDEEGGFYQSQVFLAHERYYLNRWREVVRETMEEYCREQDLRVPNRYTGCQPSGTKALLTGGGPGWHPPKSQFFTRRITFRKGDPVAMACIDYGYSVVPGQNDKDENGQLLDNPFDERVTEWLIEIPVKCPWVDAVKGDYDIEKAPITAQWSLYMQVQREWTTHNTSATLEFTEDEIPTLSNLIHKAIANGEGYISAALLAKYDAPFPRLPFEKISREKYERDHAQCLDRRSSEDFLALLSRYDSGWGEEEGPAGCDSTHCETKVKVTPGFKGFDPV